MIFINGHILTVDAKDSIAEAIAIHDDKILAVGTNADVRQLAGSATKIIDLRGHTVTPGLIDSHGHFADGGTGELYRINLSDAGNIGEVLLRVQQKVKSVKPGEWIVGEGWDEGKLAELRYIYASDLDTVAPMNPVWLMHTTGHYGVANSYALKLAHLDAAAKSPTAGTIDVDTKGAPTGVLKEAAMAMVSTLIPAVTPEQERNGILYILDELHKEGMTSVKDADVGPATWDAYRQLLDEGKLTERIFVLWHAGTTIDSARQALIRIQGLPKPPQSLGDGLLFSGGAKLYMDGSGGARTAWMYQDWNKKASVVDSGNQGYPATDPAIYRDEVRLFHQAGIHIGTHAIGDRAIDWVADTYALVLKEKPTTGLRHSIIHANIPSDHALTTMAALEKQYDAGYPEAQAPFMWWIGDTYAGNFGPERSRRLNPFKTYVARGIQWGGGSDYFVTPLPARYGIWASVERETLRGVYGPHPFGVTESVDVRTALRSYTMWAAHQLFLDDKVGSIEPGKKADLAVWDRDLYTIPAAELKQIKCEMTIFNGKVVYSGAAKDGLLLPSK